MKIIGHSGKDTHLVEMTTQEIAVAAGYGEHTSEMLDMKKALGRERTVDAAYSMFLVAIGVEIAVIAPSRFARRISEQEAKAHNAAGMLRALADMVENAVPSRSIPPIEDPDPDFAEVEEE